MSLPEERSHLEGKRNKCRQLLLVTAQLEEMVSLPEERCHLEGRHNKGRPALLVTARLEEVVSLLMERNKLEWDRNNSYLTAECHKGKPAVPLTALLNKVVSLLPARSQVVGELHNRRRWVAMRAAALLAVAGSLLENHNRFSRPAALVVEENWLWSFMQAFLVPLYSKQKGNLQRPRTG